MTRSRRQLRRDVTNDVAPSVYFELDRKLYGISTLEFENGERILEQSGANSHALAAGTSHRLYSSTVLPKLQLEMLEMLETIASRVGPPLVLHGGSEQPGSEIAGAVERGINQIQISIDIKTSHHQAYREVFADTNLRDPNGILPLAVPAVKEMATHKFDLVRAQVTASLY